MMMQFLKMRWLFNRRVGLTLFWLILLGVVAFTLNVLGIRLAGGIQSWMAWIKDHALIFLLWRLALYGAVGYGWWWMRQRVIQREQETSTDNTKQISSKNRFIRIEISAICTLLVLEITNWFS